MKTPTIQELADFTLESYTNFLRYLSKIYRVVRFCDIPQKDVPYLILRHDIDYSLPAALRMAKIEQNLGIRSTYFVLLSNKFYDVLEEKNANILRKISNLGHEIGFHYYPPQYQSLGRNKNKILDIEIQLLEHVTGKKVYSIARHGPWDRDPFATTRKYINANHPSLRKDLFVHDSCRAWTPLQGLFTLLSNPPKRVQLLTHPENWQDDKIDKETLLEKFFESLENEVATLKKDIKKVWLTNQLVLEYDHLSKMKDLTQFYNTSCNSNPKSRSDLHQLKHYKQVGQWYLVNTSFGWRFHQVINKIRNALQNMH